MHANRRNLVRLAWIAAAVLADKKMDGASIHIAVPYAIGDTRLVKIGASELRSWLTAGGVQ